MGRCKASTWINGTAALACWLGSIGQVLGGEVAAVPESLRSDPSYATYARIQIQLDLLSHPSTANLEVVVDSPMPGVIDLRGAVADARTKERLVETALRVSGLRIRQTMRINPPSDSAVESTLVNPDLLSTVQQTTALLFPEMAAKIAVAATPDGVVTLTGPAPSYEACLLLTQTAKSQPGCKAAVCRLQVPIDPSTQKVRVTEDGSQTVFATQLPTIPTGASEIPKAKPDLYVDTAPKAPRMSADDAPPENTGDRKTLEDIRTRFGQLPELKRMNWEIDVQQGVASMSANTQSRSDVELAIAVASEVPDVSKVVAKCRPVSIQRCRTRAPLTAPTQPEPRKMLFGMIPIGFSKPTETGPPVRNRRYRDAIRRMLERRCERDLQELTVKASPDGTGLILEGKVATPQKRVAVFKQIDNMAELRNVNYDAVLQIMEAE